MLVHELFPFGLRSERWRGYSRQKRVNSFRLWTEGFLFPGLLYGMALEKVFGMDLFCDDTSESVCSFSNNFKMTLIRPGDG